MLMPHSSHWTEKSWDCTERDNGLDNKTVPSRFGRLHPFSFSKILKSRNRNFNPAHPNDSSDVRDVTLILEFRYWWARQIIHQPDHRQNLWLDPEPRVTIGVAFIFTVNQFHIFFTCVSKTQWNGPPVRGQIYMGGGLHMLWEVLLGPWENLAARCIYPLIIPHSHRHQELMDTMIIL